MRQQAGSDMPVPLSGETRQDKLLQQLAVLLHMESANRLRRGALLVGCEVVLG